MFAPSLFCGATVDLECDTDVENEFSEFKTSPLDDTTLAPFARVEGLIISVKSPLFEINDTKKNHEKHKFT